MLRKFQLDFRYRLHSDVSARPVAAIIIKLVYWNKWLSHGRITDETLSIWTVIILTQIVQGLEIVATCCLNLPPFLLSLQSGFMHADDLRRRGLSVTDTYGHRLGRDTKADGSRSQKSTGAGGNRVQRVPRIPPIPHITNNGHKVSIKGGKDAANSDAESQDSQRQMIKQTATFAVELV